MRLVFVIFAQCKKWEKDKQKILIGFDYLWSAIKKKQQKSLFGNQK